MPISVTTWAQLNSLLTGSQSGLPTDNTIYISNDITGSSIITVSPNIQNVIIESDPAATPYPAMWTMTASGGNAVNTRHIQFSGATAGTQTATFDNIILDGNTGVCSRTGTLNAGQNVANVSSGGGGIQTILMTNGTTNSILNLNKGVVIQNCYTYGAGDNYGGVGTVNISTRTNANGIATCNFYGEIRYCKANTTSNNTNSGGWGGGGGISIFQYGCNTATSPNGATVNMYEPGNIHNNYSNYLGGGVYQDSWYVPPQCNNLLISEQTYFNMYGGTIQNNQAQFGGGGYAQGGNTDDWTQATFSGGTIANNTATGDIQNFSQQNGPPYTIPQGCGGGIWLMDGIVTINEGMIIENNIANGGYGGAVYSGIAKGQYVNNNINLAPIVVVNGGNFIANQAAQGAAIYNNLPAMPSSYTGQEGVNVNGGWFQQHVTTGSGAVFGSAAGLITLNASSGALPTLPIDPNTPQSGCIAVFNNSSDVDGGVIANSPPSAQTSSFIATNVYFYQNKAPNGRGGVLYSSGSGATNQFNACLIDSNSALTGGAYYIDQ